MSEFRIPRRGDKCTVNGLATAAKYNGTSGIVVKYLPKQERYQIQLHIESEGGGAEKKLLAVKRANIVLREDPQNFGGSAISIHVLVPCHFTDDRRLRQFAQCVESLCQQTDKKYRAFFSISGTDTRRSDAVILLGIFNQATIERSGMRMDWYITIEQEREKKSQFEHYKDLLAISRSVDDSAWLMFLDNDDMYHPERVKHFKGVVASKGSSHEDFDVFWSGGKLLMDSGKLGDAYISLKSIMEGKETLDPYLRVAATMEDNSVLDTGEYFDFCCRTPILTKFFDLTPEVVLKNPFCDVRLMFTFSRICDGARRHRDHEWLMMHYRVRLSDRHQAFVDRDTDRHSNAMAAVDVSDADRELADETGIEALVVATCRKDVEEQVIPWIARDEPNLMEWKKRLTTRMDRDFGHDLGTRLWEETFATYSAHFSDEMAEENRRWCMEGKVPYVVFTEEGDGSMGNIY